MEQIIETFGIDGRLIVIQIFNFTLLLAGLWYFLYTPVMNMLKERENTIAQGLKDAEAAAAAKASADEEKKGILERANQEAAAVAARAKEHADQKAADIVATADDKASNILKEAEVKGEELQEQARKESEAEISKLAILAAEKVLRKETA